MPPYAVKDPCCINTTHYAPGDSAVLTIAQADTLFAGGALVDANAPAPVNPDGWMGADGFHCGKDACVNTFRLQAGRVYGAAEAVEVMTFFTVEQILGYFRTLQSLGCIGDAPITDADDFTP